LARKRSAKFGAALAIAALLVCWVIEYDCGGLRPSAVQVAAVA
jgi:hypothetical protein